MLCIAGKGVGRTRPVAIDPFRFWRCMCCRICGFTWNCCYVCFSLPSHICPRTQNATSPIQTYCTAAVNVVHVDGVRASFRVFPACGKRFLSRDFKVSRHRAISICSAVDSGTKRSSSDSVTVSFRCFASDCLLSDAESPKP